MRGVNLNVTVPVVDLIDRLRENREEHIRIYKESVAGFKDKARRKLERALEKCDGTEHIQLSLLAPQNMTREYDNAIEALEMHTGGVIELDSETFRRLVQDEWGWMHTWLASNSEYSVSAMNKLNE